MIQATCQIQRIKSNAARKKFSSSLERAILTLERFTSQNKQGDAPTLEQFELQDGALEVRRQTTLEKTLACLGDALFQEKQKKRKHTLKPIKGTLLHSVDVIKIALMKLKNGQLLDHDLKERMLNVAHAYNTLMRFAKNPPSTLTNKIKYFFLNAAGWVIDDEVVQSEIQVPDTVFFHSSQSPEEKSVPSHKFTYHLPEEFQDATFKKIASFILVSSHTQDLPKNAPCMQEIELFHAKAHTLLKQEELSLSVIHEALKSLRGTPIETTLAANSIISLKQTISPFPGEEIELQGGFSRSAGISIPVKDKFHISSKAWQTGFPHPIQYIGIAFSEKLLPSYLLRPYLAPNVEKFLNKKREIAKKLLPIGSLNLKAKALLKVRKKVFSAHQSELIELQKKYLKVLFESAKMPLAALFDLFEVFEHKENFFEEFSRLHAEASEQFITFPILALEQEWLLDSAKIAANFDQIHAQEVSRRKLELEQQIQNATSDEEQKLLTYQLTFGALLSAASLQIAKLIFSEQMSFSAPELNDFQKKILASLFNQAEAFHQELETMQPEDAAIEQKLYQSITKLLTNEIALFSSACCPTFLASELIHYYKRMKSEHE